MEWLATVVCAAITGLCSVLVARLGSNFKKAQSASQAYQQLQEENEHLKAEKQQSEIDLQNTAIGKLAGKVDNLTDVVTEMKKSNDSRKIEMAIDQLIELSSVNFEYSQSLSTVVTSIGDALCNDDKITTPKLDEALATHREAEKKLVQKIYKVRY